VDVKRAAPRVSATKAARDRINITALITMVAFLGRPRCAGIPRAVPALLAFTAALMAQVVLWWVPSLDAAPPRPEVVVAAAANLTSVFQALGPRFEAETGIHAVFSFGATAQLARQIENGAPIDVFAAADSANVVAL
jgi:ABC-type molybdate transport system substrate-binding protein